MLKKIWDKLLVINFPGGEKNKTNGNRKRPKEKTFADLYDTEESWTALSAWSDVSRQGSLIIRACGGTG